MFNYLNDNVGGSQIVGTMPDGDPRTTEIIILKHIVVNIDYTTYTSPYSSWTFSKRLQLDKHNVMHYIMPFDIAVLMLCLGEHL